MKRIICFLRPHRLEAVKTAIAELGITGLTVNDVRGCGTSPEPQVALGGQTHVVALPIRSRLSTVVPDDLVEPIIESIIAVAQTGMSGDGKIFVEPIEDSIRIRTEERGLAGL